MDEKFTVDEFKKFLRTQDSLGDAYYHCAAENIRLVNQKEVRTNSKPSVEKCANYKPENKCIAPSGKIFECHGVCICYEKEKSSKTETI